MARGVAGWRPDRGNVTSRTAPDRDAREAVVWLAIRRCRPHGESWRLEMREAAPGVVAFHVARGIGAPRWFTFGRDGGDAEQAGLRPLSNSSGSIGGRHHGRVDASCR
jgi:hypothetical protein